MISTKVALRTMLRWSGLTGYPKGEEAQDALTVAISEAFENDARLDEFTKDWLRESTTCPQPADIYRAGRVTRTRKASCSTCGGQGWAISPSCGGAFIGFAKRCPSCWKAL